MFFFSKNKKKKRKNKNILSFENLLIISFYFKNLKNRVSNSVGLSISYMSFDAKKLVETLKKKTASRRTILVCMPIFCIKIAQTWRHSDLLRDLRPTYGRYETFICTYLGHLRPVLEEVIWGYNPYKPIEYYLTLKRIIVYGSSPTIVQRKKSPLGRMVKTKNGHW